MIIIALIRHGDYLQRANTPSAWQPYPLNEQGKIQAQQAAQALHDFIQEQALHLHPCIDTSSMLRSWQTASIILETLHTRYPYLTLHSDNALGERCVGSAANLTVTEIEDILQADPRYPAPPKNWKSDSFYQLPIAGAESLMQAGQRVAAHIQRCVQDLESQNTSTPLLKIFVGHGAAFRHAAYHLGIIPLHKLLTLSMYHAKPVYIQYQHNKYQHYAGEWKIRNGQAQTTFTD